MAAGCRAHTSGGCLRRGVSLSHQCEGERLAGRPRVSTRVVHFVPGQVRASRTERRVRCHDGGAADPAGDVLWWAGLTRRSP